jgi:CheY-like chemotaxis protein
MPSKKKSSSKDDALWQQAFRRAWSSGAMTAERTAEVEQLRKKFQLTVEEHMTIEAKLLSEAKAIARKPLIVAIDDDDKLLLLIAASLEESGFDVKTYATSDEALEALKNFNPDLILCDINLETSTIGGFTFYEKIRTMQHLKLVPFIFLTALADDALVRSGKELGVDDYITKPFEDEMLIATIKGKLKRYRDLRTT